MQLTAQADRGRHPGVQCRQLAVCVALCEVCYLLGGMLAGKLHDPLAEAMLIA